ncbi:MAG: hypothetical protein AABO57_12135, partial [Acidobacteriota bacterium]
GWKIEDRRLRMARGWKIEDRRLRMARGWKIEDGRSEGRCLDPRSSIFDPRSSILDLRSSILDPRSSILDLRLRPSLFSASGVSITALNDESLSWVNRYG